MLSSVSPVMTGADAASPQPTTLLSASIRTSTFSARRTSSPAMITGLSIGRLTAIGSMDLICMWVSRIRKEEAGTCNQPFVSAQARTQNAPGSGQTYYAGFPLTRERTEAVIQTRMDLNQLGSRTQAYNF